MIYDRAGVPHTTLGALRRADHPGTARDVEAKLIVTDDPTGVRRQEHRGDLGERSGARDRRRDPRRDRPWIRDWRITGEKILRQLGGSDDNGKLTISGDRCASSRTGASPPCCGGWASGGKRRTTSSEGFLLTWTSAAICEVIIPPPRPTEGAARGTWRHGSSTRSRGLQFRDNSTRTRFSFASAANLSVSRCRPRRGSSQIAHARRCARPRPYLVHGRGDRASATTSISARPRVHA